MQKKTGREHKSGAHIRRRQQWASAGKALLRPRRQQREALGGGGVAWRGSAGAPAGRAEQRGGLGGASRALSTDSGGLAWWHAVLLQCAADPRPRCSPLPPSVPRGPRRPTTRPPSQCSELPPSPSLFFLRSAPRRPDERGPRGPTTGPRGPAAARRPRCARRESDAAPRSALSVQW